MRIISTMPPARSILPDTGGNDILGQLFGSRDVSRAVAAQAAQATGIGQEILKQMLPAMASMLSGRMQNQMAGGFGTAGLGAGRQRVRSGEEMMKQAGGQAQPQQAPAPSGNPWGDVLGQILQGTTGGQAPQQPQAPAPSGNPWARCSHQIFLLRAQLERKHPSWQQAPAPDPLGNILKDILGRWPDLFRSNRRGNNPFGKMLEEMMKGGSPSAPETEEEAPQPRRKSAPSNNSANNPRAICSKLAKKTQETYQKGLEFIFDQYLKGMDRQR